MYIYSIKQYNLGAGVAWYHHNSIWYAHWHATLAHLEIVSMSKLRNSHMYPEGEVLRPRYFL